MHKPMKHQLQTVAKADKTDILFDMSDPGTGKTGSQIFIFAKRHKRDKKCALVIGPRTILKSAWEDDFRKFAPQFKTSIARAENREAAFAADANVYITNTDATKWLVKQKPAFFKKFSTIIVDESSAFKHHSSLRSRALDKIKKHFKYRACLTGTPNSNTICDVWNQAYFLDNGARLGNSFYAFRSSVCVPKQVGPRKEMVDWVDKDGAEEAVFGLLSDIVIRHEFDKCVDIPKTHIYTRFYDLSAAQMKAYQQMEATQIALLPKKEQEGMKAWLKGEDVPFNAVSAINAAAVRTKLLQIASGAVYESTDKYHVIDVSRYEMTMDMVAERNRPLVFYLWKHQRDEMAKLAKAMKLKYAIIDSDASDRVRDSIMNDYQSGMYDVVFAHPKSAAHGLTFTAGNSILWPSPTSDLEWFSQGNKRQRRIGQKLKTEVIVGIARGTVEETRVYPDLIAKGKRMNNFLTLFAEAA